MKEPALEGHTPRDSTDTTVSKGQNYRDGEQSSGCWGQGWGRVGVVLEGQHGILVPMGLICVLTGDGYKNPTRVALAGVAQWTERRPAN